MPAQDTSGQWAEEMNNLKRVEWAKQWLDTHDEPGFDRSAGDATDDDACQFLEVCDNQNKQVVADYEAFVKQLADKRK